MRASIAFAPTQRVEQLPAVQVTALRLAALEGLSRLQSAKRLEFSCISVKRAQQKGLLALRQRLAGGG